MTHLFGYCTNVHAGADLEQTRANLARYAVAVRQRFSPTQPMGLGLWLSASSASKLLQDRAELERFRSWLDENGLVPYTFNGFPYGDFHQRVVKHQVYLPTWWEPARLAYTRDLIAIQDALLPPGMEGSISTLPIAWGNPPPAEQLLQAAAAQLKSVALDLARLEQRSGRLIHLCLEPEPGCVFSVSSDLVRFFERYLLGGPDDAIVRRHLRVCHDVCHAAVMFEEQTEVLARYRAAGIAVGKVQVSSAVVLPGAKPAEEYAAAVRQLAGFHEERYLHQTMVRPAPGLQPIFYEDLHLALEAHRQTPGAEWRTHFHVPIYLDRFGHLEATPRAIVDCLRATVGEKMTHHYEVETYAWTVLPPDLQQPDLAAGIADEMSCLCKTYQAIPGSAAG
jgi:hypothetical protein